jgi:hypothetical protein
MTIKPVVIYASTVAAISGLLGACLLIHGYDRLCLAIDAAFSGE